MKKIALSAIALLLLSACGQELNTPLEGKWQMQQVESDGQVTTVDTIYFNFQNTLFMYQIYSPKSDSFRSEYGFNNMPDNNSIVIELTDNPVPVASFLPYTDWTEATRHYCVEKVDRKQLILKADNKKYTFRKF